MWIVKEQIILPLRRAFVFFVIMENPILQGKKKQVKPTKSCVTVTCERKCLICKTLKCSSEKKDVFVKKSLTHWFIF